MNHAPYFTGMSHSDAADAYAQHEGELQALDDARDAYAEQYKANMLADIQRDPMGYSREQCFADEFHNWLAEQPDQMDQAQSRGFAEAVNLTNEQLDDLRIRGMSRLADMLTLFRDRFQIHLGTKGAEAFDEKMKQRQEVDCD